METLLSERPARLLTVGARVTPAERQALEFEAQRRGFRNISDFTRAALGAFLEVRAIEHETPPRQKERG